jgi:hypothetical protein
MTLKSIESAAMKLPVAARGKLAGALLSSLERDEPGDIEREWVEEAERRYRRYHEGKSKPIPAKQAIAAARAACRK